MFGVSVNEDQIGAVAVPWSNPAIGAVVIIERLSNISGIGEVVFVRREHINGWFFNPVELGIKVIAPIRQESIGSIGTLELPVDPVVDAAAVPVPTGATADGTSGKHFLHMQMPW